MLLLLVLCYAITFAGYRRLPYRRARGIMSWYRGWFGNNTYR
jgi:hypothetical protein